MFTGIAILLILVVVGALVLLPLVQNKSDKPSSIANILDESDPLGKTKNAVFTTINEIEFDYKMKKLSEDDYIQLKNEYKKKALEILHEEDELELEPEDRHIDIFPEKDMEKELEAEIEQELAAIRRYKEQND